MATPVPMITVECSDGVLIDVDKEMALSMSGNIRKQYENMITTGGSPARIIVENTTGNSLMKVLDFCSVYSQPHSSPAYKEWIEKFSKLEPAELCELASAAYYLEIRPLVDLTCKSIAKLLKGKSPAEIRRTFNILYDFSPGDDVPPPTMRDKLRTKLHCKEKPSKGGSKSGDSKVDNRSVDDLVSFINNGGQGVVNLSKSSENVKENENKPKKQKNKTKKPKKKNGNDSQNLSKSSELSLSNDSESSKSSQNNSDNEGTPIKMKNVNSKMDSFEEAVMGLMEVSRSRNSKKSSQGNKNSPIVNNGSKINLRSSGSGDVNEDTTDQEDLDQSKNLNSDSDNEGDSHEDILSSLEANEDLNDIDKEVEEFRKKLESINSQYDSRSRPKVNINFPSQLFSQFSLSSLISNKG